MLGCTVERQFYDRAPWRQVIRPVRPVQAARNAPPSVLVPPARLIAAELSRHRATAWGHIFQRALPNMSLKRTANGVAPWPRGAKA